MKIEFCLYRIPESFQAYRKKCAKTFQALKAWQKLLSLGQEFFIFKTFKEVDTINQDRQYNSMVRTNFVRQLQEFGFRISESDIAGNNTVFKVTHPEEPGKFYHLYIPGSVENFWGITSSVYETLRTAGPFLIILLNTQTEEWFPAFDFLVPLGENPKSWFLDISQDKDGKAYKISLSKTQRGYNVGILGVWLSLLFKSGSPQTTSTLTREEALSIFLFALELLRKRGVTI